jgi:hypothetical protein
VQQFGQDRVRWRLRGRARGDRLLASCMVLFAVAAVVAAGGPAQPVYAGITTVRADIDDGCATSQLRLSHRVPRVAPGTSYTWFTFTNVGPTCSMFGFPGVAVLGARGRVVQHPAVWSIHPGTMPPERVRLVVLARRGQARFVLASTDVTPTRGCRTPFTGRTLQVFPPDQTTAIHEPYRGSFCDLVVGPVQSGRVNSTPRGSGVTLNDSR